MSRLGWTGDSKDVEESVYGKHWKSNGRETLYPSQLRFVLQNQYFLVIALLALLLSALSFISATAESSPELLPWLSRRPIL